MARQYFNSTVQDSLLTPASAVSPGTTATSLLSINQANRYWALPYGANAPSAGQIFYFRTGGLLTTPSSGTIILTMYHGPGTSTTAFGTSLAISTTLTPTASITAGYWRLEGELIYRTVSEVATTSTAWCNAMFTCCGPSGGSLATTQCLLESNAAVSVDTSGTGSAGTFGALNCAVTPSVTGSSWTTEYAFLQSLN